MFYGAAFDEFNREWQGIAAEEQTEPASHKEEQEIPPDHRNLKHIRTGWDMMRLR